MKYIFSTFILISIVVHAQTEFTTEEISINEWIDGTLYNAADKSNVLVLIIPGSGPTDRDGNQPQMPGNSLKFLAEGLVEKGINTFTFDKRFLKQMKSADFDESKLTFDDMVNDVVEIIDFFKKQKAYQQIYVIGHSEGSLVGMLAAQKTKIEGFVSIAGPAEPIDVILKQQITAQAPFLSEETGKILDELKIGNQVDSISPLLQPVFRKDVQPYLISWMKYNPQEEIKKLNCKVLIIYGTKDLQIPQENADKLYTTSPNAKLEIIENMNHVMKEISGGESENYAAYADPKIPVSEKLITATAGFIKINYE